MHTVVVVILAILAGSFASLITAIFTNRSARADRTFEARTRACVALEMDRSEQLTRSCRLQSQLLDPTQSVSLPQVLRDAETDALVTISLSQSIRDLVSDLNEQQEKYLERLKDYRKAPIESDRSALVKTATDEFDKFVAISQRLSAAIRKEVGIAR